MGVFPDSKMQIAITEINGVMVKVHGCTSMFFLHCFAKVDNFCDLLKLFQNGGLGPLVQN